MKRVATRGLALLGAAALLAGAAHAADKKADASPKKPMTTADVLAASSPSDWRKPDPAHTLYLELPAGRVILELAPRFAPKHVANIQKLVTGGYFDGLAVLRVVDNFVAQWGDPDEGKKPVGDAARTLPAEFTIPFKSATGFVKLPDHDTYARETGWLDGFPAARDAKLAQAWPTHCYGALGVGRENGADTGGGTELYVVIGQAPRQLDRNITLVGRVLKGIELLATLPRGTGPSGFYEKPEQRTPIKAARLASSVPEAERTPIEVLRTDTATFTQFVEARRNRRDEWYLVPAGAIDVCNIAIPTR
jgi:peptidylprolyl isomerase